MSSVPVALDPHAGDRVAPAPIAWAARAVRRIPPRAALASVLAVAFLALTGAVVSGSDVDGADTLVLRWAASSPWHWLHGGASAWVLLGQRAECLVIAAIWFTVRAVRRREIRPLLTLGVVTLLLDASVGLVKTAVGRLGPLELHAAALDIGGSRVFTDGTIFPSGHTANAAVTYGLMAMLATRHRRLGAAIAAFIACTVGLTTIYLGTHWVSDVLAGWLAGGLVLLAVPSLAPVIDRIERFSLFSAGRMRQPAPVAAPKGASRHDPADPPRRGRLHRPAPGLAARHLPRGPRIGARG
jgi:undecaprenyl-diphosphatase